MSKPTREYSNGEIVVEWRPELCVHCEACKLGLPNVFDPTAPMRHLPWVNIHGATSQEIENQVQQCPDGALSVRKA